MSPAVPTPPGAGSPEESNAPNYGSWFGLVIALLVFGGLAWQMGSAFMGFSEEVVNIPTTPPLSFNILPDASGAATLTPTCGDPGVGLTALYPSRPRWELCLNNTAFPIMIAPYFSGIFGWPLALLTRWHHNDLLLVRRFGIAAGLLSILITFAFVRRLSGARTAAYVALSLAVVPIFVLLDGELFLFESIPWVMFLSALLVWMPRRGDAAKPSSLRIAVGAFFGGLAFLGNLRILFLAVPLAFTAWRLGPRVRLRRSEWLTAGLILLLTLAPVVLLTFIEPPGAMGDRSDRWWISLARNWNHPMVFIETIRDMLNWWSNGAYVLRFVNGGETHLNLVSYALAGSAFVFVLFDGIRTLYRREGSVLSAVTASIFISHVSAVALLYSDGIRNFSLLVPTFGLAGGRALEALRAKLPRGAWVSVALPLLLVPFAQNVRVTTTSMAETRFFLNLGVEERVLAWIRAHPLQDASYVSFQSLLAGVFDSLSGGDLRVVNGDPLMNNCDDIEARRDCLVSRLRGVGKWAGKTPLRLIIPADIERYRSKETNPGVALDSRHMNELALGAGLSATLEATFQDIDGKDSLAVWAVRQAP